MGAIVSSKQDYNHTLARQPRKSIRLTQFQVPDHIRQPPLLNNLLSIPEPVRKTQNSTVETKPVAKESIQDQSVQTNSNMNRNPVILSRSVQNINKDNHRMNNSNQSIVEHNGKRFLTEFNHRMERRYVQVYDDKMNQMRFFEVTDYIPCRTIRTFRVHPQTNGFSRQSLRSNVIQRRESTRSSLLNFEDLRNRDTLNREFDSYHNGVSLSTANLNNPQPTSSPKIPLVTQNSMDSTYMYSKPEPYKPLPTDSHQTQTKTQYQPRSQEYQAPSFREHSPTTSEYSRTETEENSMVSYAEEEEDDDDYTDSEGMDPAFPSNQRENINSGNNDRLSYRSLGGHDSFMDFDPFKKKVNPRDSTYRTRDSLNNYSQPMTNNRRNPISVASDYAPITVNRNQTDQKAYAYRQDSYNYDG